jgi:hypothetical protein
MSVIDWRQPKSLENLTASEALLILGQISESLNSKKETTETRDSGSFEARRFNALVNGSDEARQFADAARRFHRRATAAHDCRPALRVAADERRVTDAPQKTPEELASEYASACREHHRKF